MPVQLLHFGWLYLSLTEARRLAERLEQELICRTADQQHDPVVVAEIPVSPADGWRVLENLEHSLAEAEVDWLTEGF